MSIRQHKIGNQELPSVKLSSGRIKLSTPMEVSRSEKESSPPSRGARKTIGSRGYYMGNISSTLNTEQSNTLSIHDEPTRLKTQQYSRKATQDIRFNTETAESDRGFRSTWRDNPFFDPDSTYTRMMLQNTSPTQKVDPNDSLIEGVRKPLWTQTQNYMEKFSKSIDLLNNSDKRSLPLSKDVFMSKAQRDLIKKFNSKGAITTEGGPIKTVKENRREVVELNSYKTLFCKIDTSYKTFPLVFKASISKGSYEIFVSKSVPYPNKDFNDFTFTEDTFAIEYENNVPMVYFSITALQHLRISFVMNFKSDKDDKLRKEKQLAKESSNLFKSGKNKPLTTEQLLDLEALAMEIKQEKKEKMLRLSKNKDMIKLNKDIAAEYKLFKEQRISEMSRTITSNFEKFVENRKQLDVMKKMKRVYTTYRRPLLKIEREWKEAEKQRAIAKQKFEYDWAILLTFFRVAQSTIEKKKAYIAIRILKRIRQDNAKRIVRAARKYLARGIQMNYPLSSNEYTDNTLEGKIKYKLCQALQGFALISQKLKKKRAGPIFLKFFADVQLPLGFFYAYSEYVKGIINFQKRWRHYSEINKARAQIFMKFWNKYIIQVIEDESKKKKKKYTDQIMKLKDKHIIKYAKDYVINKNKAFMKAYRLMADKSGSIDEILPGKITQPTPKGGGAFITTDPTSTKNSKKPESILSKKEDPKSTTEKSTKAKASYYPTKEEMKDIFEKVMEDTKFLVEGLE